MDAAIVSLGTELVRGEIVNTNASWLAERLTGLGCQVRSIEAVPDEPQAIIECLERAARQGELVVCTGGLGPTTDDLTAACVAQLLGEQLRRDEGALAQLTERLNKRGRTLTASNEKQADVPASAVVLPNHWGTAPGFKVRLGRADCYCLPGVPREMQPMFEAYLARELGQTVRVTEHQIVLRCFGLGESVINDLLEGFEARHAITVGYRARFPEVEVKILARRADQREAVTAARAAALQAQQLLGKAVYAEGTERMPAVVVQRLTEQGLTLSLAESCTGGLAASLLTSGPASSCFLGGVVSYANRAKHELLGVPEASLNQHGAVSQAVAEQMAQGARERFGADFALAFTGVAGPSGGSESKPVGTVHLALASKKETHHRLILFPAEREQVQLYSVYAGFKLLLEALGPVALPS